jgi:cellobiose phosphorylase
VTVALVALLAALLSASDPATTAAATAPLSKDVALPNIASTYGSGAFGQWTVDSFGLPSYRYTMDEQTNPLARQMNLQGASDAWSQVGNTRVKADAFNHGYTQLWSQDRLAQWTNYYDATHGHFSGRTGYVNVGGKAFSTLYDDRQAPATTSRRFGVGYYAHSVAADGAAVHDVVLAPFGNDPLLLHQVTISNISGRTEHLSWFEYWDDNPYVPDLKEFRGIGEPTWSARTQTLETYQDSMNGDTDPMTIFAAQVRGHTGAFSTTQGSFFGTGSRARPQAVAADRLPNRIASAVPNGSEGTTLFALQSTEVLRPGQSVTLRYLYGYAHPKQIPGLVAKYRAAADPFLASEHAWAKALPKLSVAGLPWLGREFLWDGYLMRSATVDEEQCGVHTITQGDYYQYELGRNLGTRSWLHYLLPMSYADPSIARQILVYAAQFQPEASGQLPYGSTDLCQAFNLGQQDDNDFWLMLAASQYALVTRDFFDRQVHYYGTSSTGSLWDHIKLAFEHQQSFLGPHGEYVSPAPAAGTTACRLTLE